MYDIDKKGSYNPGEKRVLLLVFNIDVGIWSKGPPNGGVEAVDRAPKNEE
jgi:hypothetical protein